MLGLAGPRVAWAVYVGRAVVVLVSFILDVSLNCQRWADKSDDGGAGAARTADLR